MILFNKDWQEQGARPDYQTSNKTFLHMASLFASMGIKNHSWFLALHDWSLHGLDPHSPNLTTDQKARIYQECRVNPWYMFREVARVPAGAGAPPEPIQANRANLCMWWCYYTHLTNIQIQPRQTGKSLCADFLQVEQLNFRAVNTPHNLYTKSDDLRRENITRIKQILDSLPRWMDMRSKKDTNNGESVTINALGNRLNTHLPSNSEKDAEKVGRGFTSPTNFYDELPFQKWVARAYPASMSSMDAAKERAMRAGTDYGVVITTTAGKKDDRDGMFVYKMCQQACAWDDRFYDMYDNKTLIATIRKNSSDGTETVYSCFNHRQLGKTDEWVREKIANSKGSPEEAERDYLCKWTSGTAQSPFTPAMADMIRSSEKAVTYLQITSEGYLLRWYVDEHDVDRYMNSSKFVFGLDTSDATGGDDIGFYMVDTRTCETVLTAKINETNIITFSQFLCDFMVKYKNVIGNIERRSTGGTILDYLLKMLPAKGENPFKRLFNMVVHDYDLDTTRYNDLRSNGVSDSLVRFRKLFGYATSASGTTSRNALYSDTMFQTVKILKGNFGDTDLINQLLGLVWKNGRIDHQDGGHDDLVVAMLLCFWFILFGKNHSWYGLQPHDIMSALNVTDDSTPVEALRNAQQQQYRTELNKLAEEYASCRNEVTLIRLETKMRMIEKKLVMEAGEINTVDELIRKVAEDKKKTRTSVYERQQALQVRQMRKSALPIAGRDNTRYGGRIGY